MWPLAASHTTSAEIRTRRTRIKRDPLREPERQHAAGHVSARRQDYSRFQRGPSVSPGPWSSERMMVPVRVAGTAAAVLAVLESDAADVVLRQRGEELRCD